VLNTKGQIGNWNHCSPWYQPTSEVKQTTKVYNQIANK
jgi:hypothetical protein